MCVSYRLDIPDTRACDLCPPILTRTGPVHSSHSHTVGALPQGLWQTLVVDVPTVNEG